MIYADILISCSLAAVLKIYTQHFYTSSSFAQQMNILVTVHELTLFHVRELFTVVYVVHLSKVKYNLSDFDVLKSKKISLGACLLNLFLQNPSRPIQQVTIYLCWVVVHDPFYIFNFAELWEDRNERFKVYLYKYF